MYIPYSRIFLCEPFAIQYLRFNKIEMKIDKLKTQNVVILSKISKPQHVYALTYLEIMLRSNQSSEEVFLAWLKLHLHVVVFIF